MGLTPIVSGCRRDTPTSQTKIIIREIRQRVLPNPNKFRYRILGINTFKNNWCIVRIKYLDCTNYKGVKVLVYDSIGKFNKLQKKGAIDPHFDTESYSPVARFEPSPRGYSLAIEFTAAQKKV